MRIDIITGLPKLLESPLQESILKRAQEKEIVEIVFTIFVLTRTTSIILLTTRLMRRCGNGIEAEPFFECVES